MYRRVAILIAVASATAASGLAAPDAHADPRDQQFLQMVHENHIGGDDSTLLDYARQFCDSTTGVQLPARPDLYRQGVRPDQFYAINLAASHVYCPQRFATPPTNSFKGAALTTFVRDPNTRVEFDHKAQAAITQRWMRERTSILSHEPHPPTKATDATAIS
jgi:hypothetical protein